MDDRAVIRAIRDLEGRVVSLTMQLEEELEGEILTRPNDPNLRERLREHIEQYWAMYTVAVVMGIGGIAGIRARREATRVLPILRSVGMDNEARLLQSQFSTYPMQVRRRFPSNAWAKDGRTFTQRVTTLRRGSELMVWTIVEQGVKEGAGSQEIAKRVQTYVNPEPGDRLRVARRRSVPSGSVRYNALRIARTESAHMYRTAAVDFYRDKDYVAGWNWVLSNAHPEVDECDDYAAHGIYINYQDLPESHPNCLCDILPAIKSRAELRTMERQEATV